MKSKRVISREAEKELKRDRRLHPRKGDTLILMHYPKAGQRVKAKLAQAHEAAKLVNPVIP